MGRVMRVVLHLMMLLGAGVVMTFAAEPPTEPILRIDPGMHTATIRSIAADAAGRFLVTASDDKSLRLWELPAGKLIRTIRPPIGEGHEGKLYSIALSPDGRTIAAGGWTQYEGGTGMAINYNIFLFDRATGEMTGRITGLPNVIKHLAFSPDGKWLVATLGSQGIRIYRTSNFSLAAEDKAYGSDSYSAHFSRDGRLVTTSFDGFVRLYKAGPDGWGSGRVATLSPLKVKAPDGERPFAARFSPDGTKIAAGYDDTAKVTIFSGKDLSAPVTLAESPDNGNLISITWSFDGRFLYAGGGYQKQIDGVWTFLIRRWSDGGRGKFIDIPGARNTIMELAPLPDGSVAFGSYDPAFGIISSRGKRTLFVPPANADFRNNLDGFLVANDGSKIRFGFELFGKAPALFDLAIRQLTLEGSASALTAPVTTLPGVEVTEWENTKNPKLNGTPLKLDDYERSFSLALAPEGASFVLGADWYLRCFDRKGNPLWPAPVPVPDVAWGVNISANGKIVVAALGDGSIHWYRLKDGKELLAFFPHADRKRWVLWTPSGYYDASVGGEDLIGWQVNRGKEKAADFFPASRFRDTYYRPDIVARVLATLDEKEAVRQANAERGIAKGAPAITKILPPVIEIIDIPNGTLTATSKTVTIRYKVRSPADAPATEVRAWVDNRPVSRPKKLPDKPEEKDIQEITVPIPDKDCEIVLYAENKHGSMGSLPIKVVWKGGKSAKPLPTLFVLAVGVGEYNNEKLKLNFAAKDANDVSTVFNKQKGLAYREVIPKVMTNSEADLVDINAGLTWLEKHTSTQDIAIIYLSGHGANDLGGHFYFLPHNTVLDQPKLYGLPLSSIKDSVKNISAKVVLFIDACHSGNVDLDGLTNTLSGSGVGAVVLASSTDSQLSWEREEWHNSAFTKVLVEGLSGNAESDGEITTTSLAQYVKKHVQEITEKIQTPTFAIPINGDYPIALKKK
jgi:WD40 repeat protein